MFHLSVAADAWPATVSYQLASWRRQQIFFRSQFFYAGRTWLGPAPLEDKWGRIQRRWFADCIGLAYDWGEGQQRYLATWRAEDPEAQRWLASCCHAQRLGLDGLLQLGRACVRESAA